MSLASSFAKSLTRPPLFLLLAAAMTVAGSASAERLTTIDTCRLYGYAPHSTAYAQCRMNVRRYWTTGPCGSNEFAWSHRGYCHLRLPPFI
jgi:hypothetical protein